MTMTLSFTVGRWAVSTDQAESVPFTVSRRSGATPSANSRFNVCPPSNEFPPNSFPWLP